MNDISLHDETELGFGFVPPKFLPAGETEYYIRNRQLGEISSNFRSLSTAEIKILEKNHNTCTDWSKVLVRSPFNAELVDSSHFYGLVRIGILERLIVEHHDMMLPVGISHSRIVSCDIGDNCAIHSCGYIAHYIIGNNCILFNNDEIQVTNHAKWGNGVLKDGEKEDVRVWMDVMNEAGGRAILPFDGLICADAWLWAKRREDTALMDRFKEMTQAKFETCRGEYGTIGSGSVLKSNHIIKDVKIGECAYVKGANKLKNITIKSNDMNRTQIGEGVELVNGIVGYGCRVFYGCKAVRFVMGTNSALKYGARLIHSVLGDNSTVSCCEILNNLIFPAHEQHHNTSFLVAALVKGQSNMAAGATVGSNHNSRSNDGEIDAGRGFWPGLSTSVKHSSRFASYCLLSKGDYSYELDIPFPFALVINNMAKDQLEIMPAYWWMYNMYALIRNESKFLARDKRHNKKQNVEFSPFAPDTVEEIFTSIAVLETSVGRSWYLAQGLDEEKTEDQYRIRGRELLDGPADGMAKLEVRAWGIENSHRPCVILKPAKAYKAYRHMVRWYAMQTLIAYFSARPDVSFADACEILEGERVSEWENLGGQIVPRAKVESLVSRIKKGDLATWEEVHDAYQTLWTQYPLDKACHAWASLHGLLGTSKLDKHGFSREVFRFNETTRFIEDEVLITRTKDFTNRFRSCMFRSPEEMKAVLGSPEGNSFVRQIRSDMEFWRARSDSLLSRLND